MKLKRLVFGLIAAHILIQTPLVFASSPSGLEKYEDFGSTPNLNIPQSSSVQTIGNTVANTQNSVRLPTTPPIEGCNESLMVSLAMKVVCTTFISPVQSQGSCPPSYSGQLIYTQLIANDGEIMTNKSVVSNTCTPPPPPPPPPAVVTAPPTYSSPYVDNSSPVETPWWMYQSPPPPLDPYPTQVVSISPPYIYTPPPPYIYTPPPDYPPVIPGYPVEPIPLHTSQSSSNSRA